MTIPAEHLKVENAIPEETTIGHEILMNVEDSNDIERKRKKH